MNKLLLIAMLAAFAWYTWGRDDAAVAEAAPPVEATPADVVPEWRPEPRPAAQFSCDGRTHCSQMRSCAEATYFIRHCLNTRMDGNNDGVPCERQLCRTPAR